MFSFPVEAFTRKLCSIPLLAPHPLPCSRETHFWYIVTDEVNEPSLLNQYSKILSPSERRATLHLNGTKLQKAALLARTLVRTTLSRYTNCEITPESLKFDKNKYGKPQLVWQQEGWSPPCLNFNISHTSSLIACAVTIDLQVGIDVEDKQRTLKHGIISFAKRFFSPNEVQYLHAFADPVMQQQEFIKLWTLKEAYVKALGRGFSAAPFKNFAIRLEAKEGMENNAALPISMSPRIAVEESSENLTTNWQFALLELRSHYAAICLEKDCDIEGEESDSLKLKIWKTVPFVQDEYMSETTEIIPICGFRKPQAS